MESYLDLLNYVWQRGEVRPDRTGTGTHSVFGAQLTHYFQEGFPVLTTKRLHWKSIAEELRWFLHGRTDVQWLQERGVHIWDEWADEKGSLGPIYGKQWRHWEHTGYNLFKDEDGVVCGAGEVTQEFDQIRQLTDGLREDPTSRRHLLCAWNVGEIELMKLPPCHPLAQWYVHMDGEVDCHVYMRSCDIFLGAPYNIASYALLTHLLAHCCGYTPGKLVMSWGDLHLYENHIDQAALQLSRRPKHLPTLELPEHPHKYPWEYTYEEMQLVHYQAHPPIKAPIAV